MFISPQFKACFVHPPKCAGTSITNLFAQADPSLIVLATHLRASDGQRLFPQWSKFFRFGACRHPCDALVSEYLNILRQETHPRHNQTKHMTFSDWLRHKTELVQASICAFFLDAPLDVVVRFEHLENDLANVLNRVGINPKDFALPKLNQRPENERMNWRYFMSPGDLEYVKQHYRADFELFGYSLD